jgi:hypothetical protein
VGNPLFNSPPLKRGRGMRGGRQWDLQFINDGKSVESLFLICYNAIIKYNFLNLKYTYFLLMNRGLIKK